MKSISAKLKKILLAPARAVIRLGFAIIRRAKNFTFRGMINDIYHAGKLLVKFIYKVGLTVENTVITILQVLYGLVFIRGVSFVCDLGEWVLRCTKWLLHHLKVIVMLIPKSIVRDFSYWATGLSAAAVIALIVSTNYYALALKVTVNGETVGYVENESAFSNVVNEVENKLGNDIGENYIMSSNPEYSFAIVDKSKIQTEEMYQDVYYIVCEEIGEHYGLYVDGQLVAATETEETLTSILDELKAPYVTGKENQSVEFVADVIIRKGIYAPSYFIEEDDIRAKFSSSTNPMYYTIQDGDYLSDICKVTGLTKTQLYALNPELDDTKLIPGKKLNISQPEIYLGIKIVETVTYTEEIDYKTVKIEDSSMYKTNTKVKTAGRKGEKEVTAKITYVDGAVSKKEIISEKVTRNPVTKEIYVGTKALPVTSSPLAGTGTFIRPINGGYVSCGYGGYRGHTAVDLTMSGAYGKPIYASAAGTVTYAGWSGGYGKKVIISHSGGYSTVYAHMSSFDVSTGDTVYQGQQIGRIGSTGNSTGPHLHFELRINGTAVNPMRYIG